MFKKRELKYHVYCGGRSSQHTFNAFVQIYEYAKENGYNKVIVDFIDPEILDLKKENAQLKERIEYLERSNNRREETILELRKELYGDGSYKERVEKALQQIEKQKTKMYKNRNKIALFVLMKLEKILKGDKECRGGINE